MRERGGNYPLPGTDAFYYTQVEGIPNFDASAHYPHARGRPGGPMVFKILQDNLDSCRSKSDFRLPPNR